MQRSELDVAITGFDPKEPGRRFESLLNRLQCLQSQRLREEETSNKKLPDDPKLRLHLPRGTMVVVGVANPTQLRDMVSRPAVLELKQTRQTLLRLDEQSPQI